MGSPSFYLGSADLQPKGVLSIEQGTQFEHAAGLYKTDHWTCACAGLCLR